MSGWLEKRGGFDASKSWKNRWCILSENMFRYFKTDSDNTPAGTIYAEDIEEVIEDFEEAQKDITKHSFTFKIVTKGRTFLFNAVSNAKREEWIASVKDLIRVHTEEPMPAPLKYATIEIFYGSKPGVRVNGDIGTELTMQLSNGATGKVIQDGRGWFAEICASHTTLLNLFVQHGWTLASSFSCNSIPSNSTVAGHSDMMVMTAPNNECT